MTIPKSRPRIPRSRLIRRLTTAFDASEFRITLSGCVRRCKTTAWRCYFWTFHYCVESPTCSRSTFHFFLHSGWRDSRLLGLRLYHRPTCSFCHCGLDGWARIHLWQFCDGSEYPWKIDGLPRKPSWAKTVWCWRNSWIQIGLEVVHIAGGTPLELEEKLLVQEVNYLRTIQMCRLSLCGFYAVPFIVGLLLVETYLHFMSE